MYLGFFFVLGLQRLELVKNQFHDLLTIIVVNGSWKYTEYGAVCFSCQPRTVKARASGVILSMVMCVSAVGHEQ